VIGNRGGSKGHPVRPDRDGDGEGIALH